LHFSLCICHFVLNGKESPAKGGHTKLNSLPPLRFGKVAIFHFVLNGKESPAKGGHTKLNSLPPLRFGKVAIFHFAFCTLHFAF
jgi:hypothetical protein